jgi:ribosomal protein L37AE/L43A
MECPSCLRQLAKQRTPHGYVWTCSSCGGRSVTMPVLRNAGVRPEFIRDLWHEVRASGAKAARACPHCEQTMSQVRIDMVVDRLMLDVCLTRSAI